MRQLEWTSCLLAFSLLSGSGCNKSKAPQAENDQARALALKPCPQGMLDDGEDNNNQILKQGDRDGYWFTYVDSNGTTVEPEGEFKMSRGGPSGSSYAAHIHGKTAAKAEGKAVYGGMGFSLTHPQSAFDLSHAKGISFWAKGTGRVRMKLPDIGTTPKAGHCKACYNDFGKDFELTAGWTRYAAAFADTRQEPNWGDHLTELATSDIFAIEWQVSAPESDFDLWIDNVELVGCE